MKICMVVPDKYVKGGIASVVNGYREYDFGKKWEVIYVESYCDGSKTKKLIKALKGYLYFAKNLIKNKPDIVHIHSSFGPSFYRKIPFIYMAGWKGIPVVNHIHGADFDTFYHRASIEKRKRIKRIYEKCQVLIALSEEWRRNLALLVPAEKIEVIGNYCRIPDLSMTDRQRQILFLGEIGERKGCYDIPFIYEKTVKRAGRIPLIMAGDGELAEVKALFNRNNLLEEVSFPGWVRGKDKDRLLRESEIFLFPTYHEGMPMAVLEAMAYGMAIVTTNAGGIPRLIEDGVNGYLCEPGNVEQISDRLAELSEDADKRRQLGNRARQKAEDDYSMERHMERLFSVYEKVLERQ